MIFSDNTLLFSLVVLVKSRAKHESASKQQLMPYIDCCINVKSIGKLESLFSLKQRILETVLLTEENIKHK